MPVVNTDHWGIALSLMGDFIENGRLTKKSLLRIRRYELTAKISRASWIQPRQEPLRIPK
jgi:hypothetical protein